MTTNYGQARVWDADQAVWLDLVGAPVGGVVQGIVLDGDLHVTGDIYSGAVGNEGDPLHVGPLDGDLDGSFLRLDGSNSMAGRINWSLPQGGEMNMEPYGSNDLFILEAQAGSTRLSGNAMQIYGPNHPSTPGMTIWYDYSGVGSLFRITPTVIWAEVPMQVSKPITLVGGSTWQYPTLLNGWQNYGGSFASVAYLKDAAGVVHIRGLIQGGTDLNVFILPEEYRPFGSRIFTGWTSNGAERLNVTGSNGAVAVTTTTAGFYSLEVSYWVGDTA